MTREELIRNLKYTMEKHKNDTVNTFGTNISDMCKDILDYLEQEPCDDVVSMEAVIEWLKDKDIIKMSTQEETARKELKAFLSVRPQPCEDAVSRQAVDTLVDELARAISDERCCVSRGRSTATIMQDILDLPSVRPQESCDDAVSRDSVQKEINCWIGSGEYRYTNATDYLNKRIKALQAVNPQEKAGYWMPIEYPTGVEAFGVKEMSAQELQCSECGKTVDISDGDFKYCPYCKAKMVEQRGTETWHGIHAQITAPKGTFERIFNEADDDYDI